MKIAGLIAPNINANKISKVRKKEIRNFTKEYLSEKNGYSSSKATVYNGVAVAMRGIGGVLITGAVINELPKMIDNSVLLTVAQAVTGIGSLAVALSRFESDRIATGSAKVKFKPFLETISAKGFDKKEEMVYATRHYMKKSGGFFTSVIPNVFSSKKALNLLKQNETKKI